MKKIVMMVGVIAAALGAWADTWTDPETGIRWTYKVSDGKVSIEGGGFIFPAVPISTTGAITIPSIIGGYPVTSIGSWAFNRCSGLTSVTIPDSVTSINDGAFDDCSGLMQFIVDEDNPNYKAVNGLLLTKDGSTLIAGVNGAVTIPSSVTSIGGSAFSGCSGLTSVTIPSSVTSIGGSAFSGCSGLTSVTMPNSVTNIGRSAFSRCSGLTNVVFECNEQPMTAGGIFEGTPGNLRVYVNWSNKAYWQDREVVYVADSSDKKVNVCMTVQLSNLVERIERLEKRVQVLEDEGGIDHNDKQ